MLLGACHGGDGDDRYQIALMLEQLPIPGQQDDDDGSWERYERRLRDRCLALVRRHRDEIERVADALFICRSMCAGMITHVMAIKSSPAFSAAAASSRDYLPASGNRAA